MIALLDREKRVVAETIARQVEYLELTVEREVSSDKHPWRVI